jgi:eukaryotic-like serine/threonine-protein kinase
MSAKRRTSDIRTGRAQQPKAGKSAAGAPPVSSARMAEVKSLGRYEVRGVLGKGAMGVVYDGYDAKLKRRVAIKTIQTATLDEATAKHYSMRFQREVRAVARLNHPHIVQVYDFGNERDLAYIVMEYIEGRELKDYFNAEERFELKSTLTIMTQLLDALDFAHEAGVIHRDIKPANVMIDSRGVAKLTDFGVARITEGESDEAEKTRAGAVIGTPSYMSPEQIQGQPIDKRTDIFSAGVVFYQLLTGRKPFDGSGWALAKKIIQDDPMWPSLLEAVPPVIDRIVARAMAKLPESRYQSAGKFAQALKRVAAGKPPEDPDETVVMPARARNEPEIEFWNDVKDSNDPEDVALYIEQFPEGEFVEQARRLIGTLRAKKRA